MNPFEQVEYTGTYASHIRKQLNGLSKGEVIKLNLGGKSINDARRTINAITPSSSVETKKSKNDLWLKSLVDLNLTQRKADTMDGIKKRVLGSFGSNVTSVGRVANKFRNIEKEIIQKALDELVEEGELATVEPKNKLGRKSLGYLLN